MRSPPPGSAPARGVRDGPNVQLVHDRLREAILRGEIAPGQPTSRARLAEHLGLGVSRTPLREALRMLQREGLVLSEPNRQIRIAAFSIADLEQLYAMRIALESVAIRATVPNLTQERFAQLEGLMAQMDHHMRAGDLTRWDVPHAEFHAALVSEAGPRIAALLAQLFDHGQRYRRGYNAVDPSGWPDRRREHRGIIDAAVAGDVEQTVRRVVRHYAHTAERVISGLDPHHEPALLRTAIFAVLPGPAAKSVSGLPVTGGRESEPDRAPLPADRHHPTADAAAIEARAIARPMTYARIDFPRQRAR